MRRFPRSELSWILLVGALAFLPGLSEAGEGGAKKAIAVVHPLPGETAHGVVHFRPAANGLSLEGEFWNLEPGSHGFHVHQYGNCTAPNEGSVGHHYLPIEGKDAYHGDLPPIVASGDGHVRYEAVVGYLSLHGAQSVIGRGLLVHALDGKKIACGVIGVDE